MEKKFFVLTCTNENNTIVLVKLFNSYKEAYNIMKEQFDSMKKDAKAMGYNVDDDYYNGIEPTSAGLLFGSNEYKWQITEADAPEDGRRPMPRWWWVQIYNKYSIEETEWTEEFAATCEEAEKSAVHNLDGWGVMGSYPVVKYGDRVKWHDPAISEYPEEDREYVKNRVFVVVKVNDDDDDRLVTLYEVDGPTEVEAYEHELELVEK